VPLNARISAQSISQPTNVTTHCLGENRKFLVYLWVGVHDAWTKHAYYDNLIVLREHNHTRLRQLRKKNYS
jgi:hypothetical protein